ncbi:MAG: DUF484 family protein [Gammaproteobacteria bacterium]
MADKIEKTENNPEGAEAVLTFLREHPNLLVDNPSLLSEINIPHNSGAATSLVERQVSVLREQLRQQKKQLKELIEIATENGQLAERLHILAEKLIHTSDIDSLISTIKKSLVSDFKADKIVLRILSDENIDLPEFVEKNWPEKSLFEEMFKNKKPICGRLNEEQHRTMFADELPEYGSSVLVPLFAKNWTGLLAIGSQSPDRYQQGMGTEILSQMADIVTLSLMPYLPNEFSE